MFKGGKEIYKGTERLFLKVVAKHFPNLGKDINVQSHKNQRSPITFNSNKILSRHIIIKLSKIKVKERIMRAVRKDKHITYKGFSVKLAMESSQNPYKPE